MHVILQMIYASGAVLYTMYARANYIEICRRFSACYAHICSIYIIYATYFCERIKIPRGDILIEEKERGEVMRVCARSVGISSGARVISKSRLSKH